VDNQVTSSASVVRDAVKAELQSFLSSQRAYLTAIADELIPVCDALDEYLLEGGKRLRPLFGYAGFLATGNVPTQQDIRALASLELLQACALIHDDLMDGSDTRRGKPSIHRRFESLHRQGELSGGAEQFGQAAAVLLGDLALVWSDQMLHQSGISPESLTAALTIHDEMRVELMAGQYLDVREAGEKIHSVEKSLRIARFKSGKYTIERPLHLGAVIAQPHPGKNAPLLKVLSSYGLPLGEAFQLRDDLLGVFGDPATTGKPAGDDLREGKRTVLIAMALDMTSSSGRAELMKHLGQPDLHSEKIDELRSIITESGAVAAVEKLISQLADESKAAAHNDVIDAQAQPFFMALVENAIKRSH
jgi:geranylgeranyl diphosphate synthase type I